MLVLRGEAGVGKTALLHYLVGRAADTRVVTAVGVESELELAFSSLHQVCLPLLGHLDVLPAPQRDALSIVFGLSSGDAPDRFLVGLATLTLLAEVAEDEPLVCVVDDGQWLDGASAQILAFVARRLLAERVVFVCAARSGVGDATLAGLPELVVPGLLDEEAWTLLLNNVHTPLDAAVGAQIIAECPRQPAGPARGCHGPSQPPASPAGSVSRTAATFPSGSRRVSPAGSLGSRQTHSCSSSPRRQNPWAT